MTTHPTHPTESPAEREPARATYADLHEFPTLERACAVAARRSRRTAPENGCFWEPGKDQLIIKSASSREKGISTWWVESASEAFIRSWESVVARYRDGQEVRA